MQRYAIIKHLIKVSNYKTYLEIGVLDNETFNYLPPMDLKHSVDPNGKATFNMTSDEFFANHCNWKYDIIFIDGLHLREQVAKDIENALTHLNDHGIIVVHDVLPTEEWHQQRNPVPGKPWTGDVWKAIADLRCTRRDLFINTVDTDWGCGIIERDTGNWVVPSPLLYKKDIDEWTWDYFLKNRDTLLNVVSIDEFFQMYF